MRQNREYYHSREEELVKKGGLDPILAKYIARLEDDWSEEEIIDEFDLNIGLPVMNSEKKYRNKINQAKWLIENGPDLDEI